MKPRARTNNSAKMPERSKIPGWAGYGIVILMAVMLCLSINYRARVVMNEELRENGQLTTRIQSVSDENLQLQEEIHNLKSDPRVIKREAQRLGLAPLEKVSVPTN